MSLVSNHAGATKALDVHGMNLELYRWKFIDVACASKARSACDVKTGTYVRRHLATSLHGRRIDCQQHAPHSAKLNDALWPSTSPSASEIIRCHTHMNVPTQGHRTKGIKLAVEISEVRELLGQRMESVSSSTNELVPPHCPPSS